MYCFFFYKFLIFNLTPNGCENITFLKRHTPTFFIFSAKIALFFHIYLKILPKKTIGGTIKTHEILQKRHFLGLIHISHLCFLKQMPRREKIRGNFYENQTQKTNFWEKIAAKIAQKSNTKNKIFGGKYCENRTF
jgi:hypothetical protein